MELQCDVLQEAVAIGVSLCVALRRSLPRDRFDRLLTVAIGVSLCVALRRYFISCHAEMTGNVLQSVFRCVWH